ncbi:MAG: cytochrome c oxidase assembly protein [Caulobacter sp.]
MTALRAPSLERIPTFSDAKASDKRHSPIFQAARDNLRAKIDAFGDFPRQTLFPIDADHVRRPRPSPELPRSVTVRPWVSSQGLIAMLVETAIPYCGVAPTPGELIGRWNLDALLIVALLAGLGGAILRLRGERRLWALAAIAALALIFVSPLCALSAALFSARTAHHLLLMGLAAPLLALALPWRRTPSLLTATALQTALLWGWHAPAAYAWALSHDGAYWLMQGCLLGSSLLFWQAIRAAAAPAAVAGLLAAMVQMGLLGALLTFANQAIYTPHLITTAPWGLTPLQDQQLAGLIMWAPGSALYLLPALWILGRWLGRDETATIAP